MNQPDKPLATFDQLVSSGGKRRFKYVDLPVSGLRVRIRSLMEAEVSRYSAVIATGQGRKTLNINRLEDANRRLIALCLVDAEGNPLVPDGQSVRIGKMDSVDTSHLYEECAAFCGINTGDIEDLVKNSETTPDDG